MIQDIQIFCKNNQTTQAFPIGSSLREIYPALHLNIPYEVVSAKVNNKVEGLNYRVYHNKDVEFLDISCESGLRTYVRSLCFVLCKAVEDLYPHGQILLEHPVSKGYYCDLRIGREVTLDDVKHIKKRMAEIVEADMRFHRLQIHTQEAIKLFQERGMEDKVKLLRTTGKLYTYYYTLGDSVDYYYGSLLPSTGCLRLFDLVKYYDGLLLRFPDRHNPTQLGDMVKQEKMLEVFKENKHWQEIMGVSTVGEVNEAIQKGMATDIINVSEALQEKRISNIADDICERGTVKVVLIAGPSSSGKTTFSKRLSVQLMANGKKPLSISLDDYFVDREHTPRDANGDYDYESLYALDLELFNQHMQALIKGEQIELPRFNFSTGQREHSGNFLKLEEETILILEGIHGLNPELTPHIADAYKYRIYVSALTTISLDNHNYIPTTDNRLLRRIIRDYNYRGYSAEETIKRWPSVRAGEHKWIFPYQENADAMFNSALLFELSVLKTHVEPVLYQVPESSEAYSEAYRLRRFLEYFIPVADHDLPPTSLLREFLGGSSFTY